MSSTIKPCVSTQQILLLVSCSSRRERGPCGSDRDAAAGRGRPDNDHVLPVWE
jgi:hypothetical protein